MYTWLNATLFALSSRMLKSRFNPDNQIASLYFHRVVNHADPYAPDDLTYRQLRSLVRVLKRHYRFVGADDVLPGDVRADTPTLMLTFDDGYCDNFDAARRLKDEEGIVASFFIASAGTETGYLWQDALRHAFEKAPDGAERAIRSIAERHDLSMPPPPPGASLNPPAAYHTVAGAIKYWPADSVDAMTQTLVRLFGEPYRCMMTSDELRELAAMGHTVGAHTHHHRILSTLSEVEARTEIETSKAYLESVLGKPVLAFAYPNGQPEKDYRERDAVLVEQAGFKVAYTTQDTGFTTTNAFHRGRFLPYRTQPLMRALSTMKIAGDKA